MFLRFALYGFLKNLRFFEPFVILIFREAGLSFLQIGILYSVRGMVTNLFEVPSGLFADTFGRRRSLILAFVAYLLSFALFYGFSAFSGYLVAMVCFGMGEAFRSGTHKAIILEYLRLNDMQDRKVRYYGRTRAASQLGSAVNALLAAALVFYTDRYQYLFAASAVPYLLGLVNVMGYPAALDEMPARGPSWGMREEISTTWRVFLGTFKGAGAVRAILSSATFTASFKSAKDYLQPIVQALSLSLLASIALSETRRSALAVGGVYFVVHLLASWASHRADAVHRVFSSSGRAVNATFLLGAWVLLASGVATWLQLGIAATGLFALFYVVQNLRKPMTVALISDRIDPSVMASGFSVESQVSSIFQVAFAPFLGGCADRFGVGPALILFGGMMVMFWPMVRVRG